MEDYFAMGGHGFYIWTCYAIAFIGLALLGGVSVRGFRATERERGALEALTASRPRKAQSRRRAQKSQESTEAS